MTGSFGRRGRGISGCTLGAGREPTSWCADPGGRPRSPATLREAGGLAALHSRFSGDGAVEVMAVEAARVRKVKGASPGRVTVAGESTLRVAPGEGKARPV